MTASYVEKLLLFFPAIRQVWLIGSQVSGTATPSSDWDYIVMADQPTLNDIAASPAFNEANIDLLVVYDGDRFRKPWPDGARQKQGSLSGWQWEEQTAASATYRAVKPRDDDDFYVRVTAGVARRVYP
jgi:hypothetical protein